MPFNVCTDLEDCVVFHQKHAFYFMLVSIWMCIAAHACVPPLQPATTSGWNWSRLAWELIWQTSLSQESLWKLNLMKAHTSKTCRLTSAQDFSCNQLHSLVKAKPHGSRLPGFLFLTWVEALYNLVCVARGVWPVGLGNLSKPRCVI